MSDCGIKLIDNIFQVDTTTTDVIVPSGLGLKGLQEQ